MEANGPEHDKNYIRRAIELLIKIAVLLFIFGWCYRILTPFFSFIIWGIVIAIAAYPLFKKLEKKLGGRPRLAAVILTLLLLSLIITPAWILGDSLMEGISNLREAYHNGNLIPPPGDRVKNWPAIAKPIVDLWTLASDNMQAAVMKYSDEFRKIGQFVLSILVGTGLGILEFIVSIIIAGVLLAYTKEGGETAHRIFFRLAGEQGAQFVDLSERTIRSVVKGILGVAFIQTLMAGIGFVAAGVPAAGLWTFLCLILAIIQIGVGPVAIGIAIYMFASTDILTASLLAGWTVLVVISDNILKPILLGKGTPSPMLVVLLGSLGGLAAHGFLGLFLGPVLLSLGYKLFQQWLAGGEPFRKPD